MRAGLKKGLIYLVVTVAWLSAMGMLIGRYYADGVTSPTHKVIPQALLGEHWMGVYMEGEKVGYSMTSMQAEEVGYRLSELLKIRLRVMGEMKDVETSIEAMLDGNLLLVSFDATIASDLSARISGKVEGKELKLTLETGGSRQERTIALAEPPSLDAAFLRGIGGEKLRVGQRFSVPVFDPAAIGMSEMTMEVTGKEKLVSMGEEHEAFRISGRSGGVDFTAWVNSEGIVLREETGLGFVFEREGKKDAMRIGLPSSDIIARTSVPFNLELPLYTKYLKVRVSGIKTEGLELEGGRQRLRGDVLEITTEPTFSSTKEDPRAYLEETPAVQSSDPAIVSLAREIVSAEEDPWERAGLINEWVYENIKKESVVGMPSALGVLKTGRGDCNEHTALYTALARASGIPTRMAVGLAYRGGAFYYHAWPEVYIDGWRAVDPTFGQYPADAAHIRLLTGGPEKQGRLFQVMGRIKLEGLGFK